MDLLFISILIFFGAILALYVVYQALLTYARGYAAWENKKRHGMSYYGRPLAERQAFRGQIKRYSCLMPAVILLEKFFRLTSQRVPSIPSLHYENVTVPSYSCTRQSVEKAKVHQFGKDDIFVVTQMKSGTTWMQQIVFEILNRGRGDLTDKGFGHLYAVSPWLESIDGVSMEAAPLIGEGKKRLIKTHLPVSFCYHPAAKYIYVMRHPVSCFASVFDYFRLMSGPLMPPKEVILDWFCSSGMWFTPWPDHVSGWWAKSREVDNVLFLAFEDMKQDPGGAIRRTAQFLGVSLSEAELALVEEKSSFQAMKANQEYFEMSPPNFCSVRGSYFVDGSASRYQSVTASDGKKIYDFCASRLNGNAQNLMNRYKN